MMNLNRVKVSHIAGVHTACSIFAFLGTLAIASYLHLAKIVKNEFYGYPEEWFPSISATIGDWYPERSFFQIIIALTATPRLILLWLWTAKHASNSGFTPLIAFCGLCRSLLCGGWIYVSSTDDHDFHDIFMISYLMMNIPWFFGAWFLSEPGSNCRKIRIRAIQSFFGVIPFMIYLFIQHKVHAVPGTYSKYSIFEWSLVFSDIIFDSSMISEFANEYLDVKVSEPPKSNTTRELYKYYLKTIDTVSEVYLAFISWSMITSLGVSIWDSPQWYMGISGYEACLLATATPIILWSSTVLDVCCKNLGLIHFSSFLGVAAYQIHSTSLKLLAITAGVVLSLIVWIIKLTQQQSPRSINIVSNHYLLGLLASTVLKYAYKTNNPVWPVMDEQTGGLNPQALTFAVMALLWGGMRHETLRKREPNMNGALYSLATSAGVGATLYGLQNFLCDAAILILNVSEGYPILGPKPALHGVITIAAMALSIISGAILATSYILNPNVLSAIVIGACVYHNASGWKAYISGLIISCGICLSSATIMKAAAQFAPGPVFGIGLTFYAILSSMSVWTVTDAFVPGGEYMRERTDILMISTILLFSVGFISAMKLREDKASTKQTQVQKVKEKSTEVKEKVVVATDILRDDSTPLSWKVIILMIAIGLVTSAGFTAHRRANYELKPYHQNSKLVTAGIWTFHSGHDNVMRCSEGRKAELIRDLEVDILGISEIDAQRMVGGYRDISQNLAETLGMYADYSPSARRHTSGIVLLSKFPIVKSAHHMLPSLNGEVHPAIHATLDVFGSFIDVIVSHNGQKGDSLDREVQSKELCRIIRNSDRPLIFLDYIVSILEKDPQTFTTEENGMHDTEQSDGNKWCEYILGRKMKRMGNERVHCHKIRDTELQTGKFMVDELEGRNERINEDEVS